MDESCWTYRPNGEHPKDDGYMIISPAGREVAMILGSEFAEGDVKEAVEMLNEALIFRRRAERNNA